MITRDLVCDIMAAEMAPIQELSETNTRQPQHISAPKPAWGKITQVVETASLSDVMSEQLASRIQEKELEDELRKEGTDEALAKALQEEEKLLSIPDNSLDSTNKNLTPNADSNPSNTVAESTDTNKVKNEIQDTNDDFLIAQMLQKQYDTEYDNVVKNEEKAYNRNSKIKVSYKKYKILQSDNPIWEDSDDEDPELLAYLEMDDRKRDWDYFESADKETLPMPR